ncbi:unnamed protein product [Brassica oleracea var. botrytis]
MATISELSRLIRDHGDDDEVWITHYSSNHRILLVGEGDFSFSCSLATRFRSASNICASSLDSYLTTLPFLTFSDPCILASTATLVTFDFYQMFFDCFVGRKHRELVFGFFHGASHMVRADGEVHVSHKNKPHFCHWKLEELASKCSLALTQCVAFEKSDYPGYENKRGDGSRCDMPFLLGECTTFKFRVSRVAKEIYAEKVKGREMKERESNCQRPALTLGLSYHHPDHNLRQVDYPLVQSRQRTLPLDPYREHRCSHFEDSIVNSIRASTQRPATFNHAMFIENSMQLDPLRYAERSSRDFSFQPSLHPQEERSFFECSSRFDGVPLDIYVRRMQSTLTQTSFPHLYTGESPERRRQEPFKMEFLMKFITGKEEDQC